MTRERQTWHFNNKSQTKVILGDTGAVSRVGRKGATKVFKYGRKSPWVPTLTELFPKIQADAGSWLGTKNAWVLFVCSFTTAIVSITACLAHPPKKCTQSGNFQFDIKSLSDFKILYARIRFFKNTSLISLQQVFTVASATSWVIIFIESF